MLNPSWLIRHREERETFAALKVPHCLREVTASHFMNESWLDDSVRVESAGVDM